MSRIRLVTFDVLHTLIAPRRPVHVQYSEVFHPYLGPLEPEEVKRSFKSALKAVQKELPTYKHGAVAWWSEVIKRTAVGAGADPERVQASLNDMVPALLKRFSSGEGYMAFSDAIPTVTALHEAGIHVGIISNGDSRFRLVLEDLGFPKFIEPIALSEEIQIEKPSPAIFRLAVEHYNKLYPQDHLDFKNCLHIGDELDCDYHGAIKAGFNARLLRRPGLEGAEAHKDDEEKLDSVEVIQSLCDIPDIATARRTPEPNVD